MALSPQFLKMVRLTHLYVGVFIAPALLFFAFTGALQTFSLHETTRGSSYQPPKIFVLFAQIHKKQTPVLPQRKPQASPDASPEKDGGRAAKQGLGAAPASANSPSPIAPAAPRHNAVPLKIFFLLVALGLFLSTLSGIYMTYAYTRNKLLISLLLAAGTAIPLLMILV